MNTLPVKSAANPFIPEHVVYANTKKMADKSRLDTTVVFLTFILNMSVANISGFVRLEPGKPLVNQVLYHRKTVVYHLVQLQPSRSYELRISYPSTVSYFSRLYIVFE
ncbi:uncharacterized protein LOC110046480 [Orbicella faveolata]|uniref:uncharacterized protein LOC110046480 n=1 Tax=Orbicella faveolata TaxID=48498 RepID=UPI0009E1DB83|nr:uncharacterized protein LOC110046480 [Orbicella faveolata]